MRPYQYDVFISHASSNKRWVEVLARNLSAFGKNVFVDFLKLIPGKNWMEELCAALDSSRTGIIVVSPEAYDSGWVREEYQRMFIRKGKDPTFEVIPALLTDAADFPFLSNVQCVDFRNTSQYREAFFRLLCGIEGRTPGSRIEVCTRLEIPELEANGAATGWVHPAFLGELLETLSQSPIVLLLSQANVSTGHWIRPFLQRVQERFRFYTIYYVAPSYSSGIDTSEYFRLLGKQCGFSNEMAGAFDFETAFLDQLTKGEYIFLFIRGFEHGSEASRRELAGVLRNLYELFPYTFRVVICGGEKLADLKYAQGELSLLSLADVYNWPEMSLADVNRLSRMKFPQNPLTTEGAKAVLRATGRHPHLIRYCLELWEQGTHIREEEFHAALLQSSIVWEMFTPFVRESERVCLWLKKCDLGPAFPYIFDSTLRRLYWKNLLAVRLTGESRRLCWRSETIRQAGLQILDCL